MVQCNGIDGGSWSAHAGPMDAPTTATQVAEPYPRLYAAFCRRRDPRAYHPAPEAMACLEHLAATGPLTVQEAARHLDRSQSATSERLHRLVEQGLIERLVDQRDRRRHLHWLSKSGEALWRRERAVLDEDRLTRVLGRVPVQKRRRLVDGMRALLDAVAADAESRGEER